MAGNPFQTNPSPNVFGNNQQQSNLNNPFASNQGQPNNFSGQNQNTANNPFASNQNQNQQQNIFGQNQQNQGNNPLNQNQSQQQQNPFGNNQQGQPNLFGNNQQHNQSQQQWNQGQQQGVLLNNQQQQNTVANNPFNQQNQNVQVPNLSQPQLNNFAFAFNAIGANSEYYRQMQNKQIVDGINRLNITLHQLQSFRIDDANSFRAMKVNANQELKPAVTTVMRGLKELKKVCGDLKRDKEELQKAQLTYIQSVRKKLQLYKQCLIQSLAQNSMIEQITAQIDGINQYVENFFKPIVNAYRNKGYCNFADPDEFVIHISEMILKKMQILSQKVSDLEACKGEHSYDALGVFEQLLEYYQNVSLSLKEFLAKYNHIKKAAIEKKRRGGYEEINRKINQLRVSSLGKGFKQYELVKHISSLLDSREKRQKQHRQRR